MVVSFLQEIQMHSPKEKVVVVSNSTQTLNLLGNTFHLPSEQEIIVCCTIGPLVGDGVAVIFYTDGECYFFCLLPFCRTSLPSVRLPNL